jgi:hypothetical protein
MRPDICFRLAVSIKSIRSIMTKTKKLIISACLKIDRTAIAFSVSTTIGGAYLIGRHCR